MLPRVQACRPGRSSRAVETISAQVGAPASVTVRGETRQQEIDSPPMMMQVALLANAPMTARAASAPAFQLESLRDDVFGSREARPAGGDEAYGLHLPEPGTGSALLATAALMAFFFLRRSAR